MWLGALALVGVIGFGAVAWARRRAAGLMDLPRPQRLNQHEHLEPLQLRLCGVVPSPLYPEVTVAASAASAMEMGPLVGATGGADE